MNKSVAGSVVGDQIKEDDQLLRISNYEITPFGQCNVPWNKEGPVDFARVTSRFTLGDSIPVKLVRQGDIIDIDIDYIQKDPRIIRPIYFPYEQPKSAIYAGMVVQELNLNLVNMFMKVNPLLGKYASLCCQCEEPCLVVSYVLEGGLMGGKGAVSPSMTLNSVNGKRVRNLEQLKKEISKESAFYKIEFHDNVHSILSNTELLQDHQFMSMRFGGMLQSTELLTPVAYHGEDCSVGHEHIGCKSCGGKDEKKHTNTIEKKYHAPKKKNSDKNTELGLLIKNVSAERIVDVAEEDICCDPCEAIKEEKIEYDEWEIAEMKRALPLEMLTELGII